MLGENAGESTFDKFHLDSFRKQVMAREPIPFFAVAHSNTYLLQSTDVDVLVISICRVVTSVSRLLRWQVTSYIQ